MEGWALGEEKEGKKKYLKLLKSLIKDSPVWNLSFLAHIQ